MVYAQSCSYFASFTIPLKLALRNCDAAAGNVYAMFKVVVIMYWYIKLQLKPDKFFIGNSSQIYRVSLVIWDHTILLATRHKPTQPALTPASEGWYSL